MNATLPTSYFEGLYARAQDPWKISVGWYEARKRALVIAALPRPRFALGFEPGCGNGELTRLLADRCDRLVAWDVVGTAVRRARELMTGRSGVEVRDGRWPDYWPDGSADLIVLSEVGYYLGEGDLVRGIDSAVARLADAGTLVAVHWRHDAPDYPLTGDRVHRLIQAHSRLDHQSWYGDEDFLLDVFRAGPAKSIAREQGLLGDSDDQPVAVD